MATNQNQQDRYERIISYYQQNKDRLGTVKNQEYLTKIYAELLHTGKLEKNKDKSNNHWTKELADKLYVLVGGPNYLLGHWEELNKLEAIKLNGN